VNYFLSYFRFYSKSRSCTDLWKESSHIVFIEGSSYFSCVFSNKKARTRNWYSLTSS